MCASYWNLKGVEFTCPDCDKQVTDDLQTHFMGDMSFMEYYKIGEKVPLLGNMTVTLRPIGATEWVDDFIGSCPECDKFWDFGAQITDGVVTEVWLIPQE